LKVVFDTNIFISAFVIPGGKAEAAYSHALRKDFTLYSSVAILTETAQKLGEKFGWQQDKITSLLKAIAKVAIVIFIPPSLSRVISTAMTGDWGSKLVLAIEGHRKPLLRHFP
jgi:putative PIN family toxin of toxin-antitoxin system